MYFLFIQIYILNIDFLQFNFFFENWTQYGQKILNWG